jgi:urea transport system substrate-binding protein
MSSKNAIIDRRQFGLIGVGLVAAAATGLGVLPKTARQAKAASETGPIKIGILHSLSGTMAIS